MKKALVFLAVIVFLSFLTGLIFHKPGIFYTVIGILALLSVIVYAKQSVVKLIAILTVNCLLIIGGSKIYKATNFVISANQVHASDINEVFIVDAQNIDYPVPIKMAAAEKAAKQVPKTTNVSLKESSSGNCANSYPESIETWCSYIETSASKYGVDPKLIAAVMLQESGGQPEILSASGAVGLLQVMPRDGISAGFICANGPCFANRPSIEELKNPQFNVDYGTKMLANLISRWGSEREALKNYGPLPSDLLALYGSEYYYADKVIGIRNGL